MSSSSRIILSEACLGLGRGPSMRVCSLGMLLGASIASTWIRIPLPTSDAGCLRCTGFEGSDCRAKPLALQSSRYEHIREVPFVDLLKVASRIDIGIAPLADTVFNRSRSNVKLKEYASGGAAWLASPVGPYRGLGEDQGGMLVEDGDWMSAIDLLIRDRRRRRRLCKHARRGPKRKHSTAISTPGSRRSRTRSSDVASPPACAADYPVLVPRIGRLRDGGRQSVCLLDSGRVGWDGCVVRRLAWLVDGSVVVLAPGLFGCLRDRGCRFVLTLL